MKVTMAGKSLGKVVLAILFILPTLDSNSAEPNAADELTGLQQKIGSLFQSGKYSEALPLAKTMVELVTKAKGPEHPDTAAALNNLASLYLQTGDYANAESVLQNCIEIAKKAFGPNHPRVATAFSNLAMLYTYRGEYTKAEPLMLESLKLKETANGPDHPSTVNVRNNLAAIYQDIGDYTKAEQLLLQSLKIMRRRPNPEDALTANVFNNLAVLYQDMGDYAKAEPLLMQSLALMEKVHGEAHPDTATVLQSLASLQAQLGNYVSAESFSLRSLNVARKLSGPDHPDTAASLNNLGTLYVRMADYTKAEPVLLDCLKIRQAVLGAAHPDTATTVNNLAALYTYRGDYAKAESFFTDSLKATESAVGTNHPYTATSLCNLGSLYIHMGDYAKAEPMLERCLKIRETVLGASHPDTATACSSLAFLKHDQNQLTAAISLAITHKSATAKVLRNILSFTSEQQRLAYQSTLATYDLLATLSNGPELAEVVLRTKGVVLDSLLEDQLVADASTNPEVKGITDQLRIAGSRLTQLQMETPKSIDNDTLKRRQTKRESLERQVEDLQKTLATHVTSLGQTRRALRVTVPDVQSTLAKGTVLTEFFLYRHYLGKGNFESRYGAVLIGNRDVELNGAKVGEPVWVPLGSADSIEKDLTEYATVMNGDKPKTSNLLRSLHALLFDPIQKKLPKEVTTLIISPDAQLNSLNFATLLSDDNRFLGEHYSIKYVASGRDLVLERKPTTGPHRLVAFANPMFGEKPQTTISLGTNTVQTAMWSSDRRGFDGMTLNPLTNSVTEVESLKQDALARNVEVAVYKGAEATEAQVKAVKSPYILHLATHGFFLPEIVMTNTSLPRLTLSSDNKTPGVLHNPMFRSGLAFAGAQLTLDAWKRGEIPDPENDGILMAQEVGTMDLHGTWLVTLSACDTGTGEIRAGEGVLGLRRGFIQAGAQNLLMTLWPVSDRFTAELMKSFYDQALQTGDAPQALANVQREYLERVRKQEGPIVAARLAGPFIMTFQGRN